MLGGAALLIGGMSLAKYAPETFDRFSPIPVSENAPPPTISPDTLEAILNGLTSEEREAEIRAGLNDPETAAETFNDMSTVEQMQEALRSVRETEAALEQEHGAQNGGSVTHGSATNPNMELIELLEASPDKAYLSQKLTEWTYRGMRIPEVIERIKEHERAAGRL
jgi:hypothetical protein